MEGMRCSWQTWSPFLIVSFLQLREEYIILCKKGKFLLFSVLWTLGVRWHVVTVLASATGHQLSCTFGSVLSFLGTISQHHHHGWGARRKGQNPPVATPHPGFLHLHWADFWQSGGTTLRTRGSASTALLHAGRAAEIHSGLPCSSWLCSCTPQLAPWAPAPDTCACQHLCCFWEQLNTCSLLRHRHPPSQNPSAGLLELLKVFLPPFHFVPPVSGNDRRQNRVWAFYVLLFSCGFLECGW